jgi:predicted nucleotidyltransferase
MAVLADAALDESEREVLDRLVRELVDEYGDDLDGVWLYGSRARGERPA